MNGRGKVRIRNSSWEADEQSRATVGVGGASAEAKGECEAAKHAPVTQDGKVCHSAGAPNFLFFFFFSLLCKRQKSIGNGRRNG